MQNVSLAQQAFLPHINGLRALAILAVVLQPDLYKVMLGTFAAV